MFFYKRFKIYVIVIFCPNFEHQFTYLVECVMTDHLYVMIFCFSRSCWYSTTVSRLKKQLSYA